MPNFRSIGPFKQKLQRVGAECALPWPYQSAKSPACLGLIYEFERQITQATKEIKMVDDKSVTKKKNLIATCCSLICSQLIWL